MKENFLKVMRLLNDYRNSITPITITNTFSDLGFKFLEAGNSKKYL